MEDHQQPEANVFTEEQPSEPVESVSTSTTAAPVAAPAESATDQSNSRKKQWIRSTNYEERMWWCCNLFYCFYFPYICKIDAITEEDVPVIAEQDKTEINAAKFKSKWDPAYKEYTQRREQYLKAKYENPKFEFLIFNTLTVRLVRQNLSLRLPLSLKSQPRPMLVPHLFGEYLV